ncbi:major facilitator superfamily domain-containing protein [Aspergillus pseudoustus]|uniref:Major facilitator superfamily domain-containing protein n=1 Tax=Aspergillus pseudoustus TaxID=1810923 RepID=A0ABR4JM81_9EURO
MAVETTINASSDTQVDLKEALKQDNEKGGLTPQASESSLQYDEAEVKRIKRKIDIRLCVVVAVMYTVCQIDRVNLANAVVAGMGLEIDLTGQHYSTIVAVFFPTYTVFQPLMTVIARKIGPRIFMGFITVAWGLVMVGMGLVNDWKHLAALRVILGLFEAGLFPAAVFLISSWYIRHETGKRIGLFYLLGSAISSFGGILAYGLQQMNGLQGHAGWRWIFIIEGVLTVVVGLVGFILIVDFPEDARRTKWFLTDREIDIMIDRVEKDRGDAHLTPFVLKEYLSYAFEWQGWLLAVNFLMTAIVIYAVSYFLPIVLMQGLNFDVAEAQTLTAPCFLFGTVLGLTESWLSDKYKLRGPVVVFNAVLQIIGIALLGYAKQNGVRYLGAFILTGSCNANIPAALTYQSNNITGQWRRAFGSALIVAAGGVGGVIGGLVFREQDKPDYEPGLWTCFIAAGITIISVGITTVTMGRRNKQQKNGREIFDTPGFRFTL